MKSGALRVLATIGALTLIAGLVGAIAGVTMIRRGFSARDEPSAIEAFLARRMRSWATPAATRDLRNPLDVTPALLESARAHWADHCANCHGNDGKGETTLGQSLFPRSPNMREADTQSLSDGELYAIIENGIRLTGMPAWGDGKPDNRGSWELVAFIRHLPKQSQEELEDMKKLNPISAHEAMEEKEEADFLGGPSQAPHENHPHQQGEK